MARTPRGPSGPPETPPGDDPAAVAAYIAALVADLSSLARRHEFDTLVYLLDMTRLEAEGTAQRISGS